MSATKKEITVSAVINSPVARVWDLWTDPYHIMHWNNASNDWHTTRAENDLTVGGKFLSRMEARNGKAGFDFTGVYNSILKHKFIGHTLDDGRNASIIFAPKGNGTEVTETFEAEDTNPLELQRAGWQAILNNFKNYAENKGDKEVLHFEIIVNSSAEKVFKAMLEEITYRQWTAVFNPSSHFEGSWKKGSKILFLGTDKNGNIGGMVSTIKENIPNRFISIEHIGEVKNGKEILCGPEVDAWKGSLENYSFTSTDGKTVVSVDIDSNNDFRSYFLETWPRALEKLRSICE